MIFHHGPHHHQGSCTFKVWAPLKERMILHLVHPEERRLEMRKDHWGYFTLDVEDAGPGTRYFYRPDDEEDLPDPASHHQPDGVHKASAVVDHSAYQWHDGDWRGKPLNSLVIYELHVGTFTPQGTFKAIIPRLDELLDIGIDAIELMPVCQFPGNRNWGYDGVHPYSVQNTYGGPEGLKELVGACHARGISVILDVVHNHLGPEGNYFSRYGPYFTHQYNTPWGDAINFDQDWCDGVREFFVENLLHWVHHYHIDGFRMDAIHTVFDTGAMHYWELCHQKLKEAEARCGRAIHMIAESDMNSPRVTRAPQAGGFGFDAQWLDDFHHALYVLLDPKGKKRYADYGRMDQLAKAYKEGFVFSGEHVNFRHRRHGRSSAGVPGDTFIVFNQNHDQIGNRVRGERLCALIGPQRQMIAAAAVLLAPYIPLLFMGEEHADPSPFFYFVSHSDQDLVKSVQEGRKREFEQYGWDTEPPDPQAQATFNDSRLQWGSREKGHHARMLRWHKELIALRRGNKVLVNFNKNDIRAQVAGRKLLELHRQDEGGWEHVLVLFNFDERPAEYLCNAVAAHWTKLIGSTDQEWADPGTASPMPDVMRSGDGYNVPPLSVTVYHSASGVQAA